MIAQLAARLLKQKVPGLVETSTISSFCLRLLRVYSHV
jgi:hypothetical protein